MVKQQLQKLQNELEKIRYKIDFTRKKLEEEKSNQVISMDVIYRNLSVEIDVIDDIIDELDESRRLLE